MYNPGDLVKILSSYDYEDVIGQIHVVRIDKSLTWGIVLVNGPNKRIMAFLPEDLQLIYESC